MFHMFCQGSVFARQRGTGSIARIDFYTILALGVKRLQGGLLSTN